MYCYFSDIVWRYKTVFTDGISGKINSRITNIPTIESRNTTQDQKRENKLTSVEMSLDFVITVHAAKQVIILRFSTWIKQRNRARQIGNLLYLSSANIHTAVALAFNRSYKQWPNFDFNIWGFLSSTAIMLFLSSIRSSSTKPRRKRSPEAPSRAVWTSASEINLSHALSQRSVSVDRLTVDFDCLALPGFLDIPNSSAGLVFGDFASIGEKDCPKYKAHDQSLDTTATAVMAVDEDEIDVPLASSEDGKSDWMANNTASRVVGKGSVQFRMADGRSVTLTEIRHVPNLRKNLISIGMLDSKGCNFDASGGTLRVSKGNKEMLWGKKTGGLYRLEGSVQTGGATIRHGSSGIIEKNGQGKQPLHRGTQSKRKSTWRIRNGTWRIRNGTRVQGNALGYVQKSGQTRMVQLVQDVQREAQRKETKSILKSCTAKGAVTPNESLLISGDDLSSCEHKGGEMELRQLTK
ncbi:hypothetical protein Acr_23g0006380 [Actinidia rufa]|uniref:Retrovirus-related Pol polyprotein from transposon TNT 1-94-like beta-barrel domain-containing protein n=1 Tax=Actinidia rufa TaxID=165716 RepID=A0A7J0GN67_9ERIC|nr:hypothetical protein Acr_23g0006380 [Actinidia rufa]